MDNKQQKRKIDTLFMVHAIISGICGTLAYIFPHFFLSLIIHRQDDTSAVFNHLGENNDKKVIYLVVRIYGALVAAQGYIVWYSRQITDAYTRRALVQAYTIAFALTSIALLRAQLTEGGGFNVYNWISILIFVGLTIGYGYFVFFEKIKIFESLDRSFR